MKSLLITSQFVMKSLLKNLSKKLFDNSDWKNLKRTKNPPKSCNEEHKFSKYVVFTKNVYDNSIKIEKECVIRLKLKYLNEINYVVKPRSLKKIDIIGEDMIKYIASYLSLPQTYNFRLVSKKYAIIFNYNYCRELCNLSQYQVWTKFRIHYDELQKSLLKKPDKVTVKHFELDNYLLGIFLDKFNIEKSHKQQIQSVIYKNSIIAEELNYDYNNEIYQLGFTLSIYYKKFLYYCFDHGIIPFNIGGLIYRLISYWDYNYVPVNVLHEYDQGTYYFTLMKYNSNTLILYNSFTFEDKEIIITAKNKVSENTFKCNFYNEDLFWFLGCCKWAKCD